MLFLGEVWSYERVYVHSVFRDLLERINNKRVKQSQRLAVCFIVKFLPYVFVPAGRSCFWLPKLTGLIVQPVNQKMQIGDHQCVIIGQFCDFFTFIVRLFACLCPEGGSRVPPLSGSPWQPVALARQPRGSVARHNSTQTSFYKCAFLNVLFSSLGFYMQHTKMSLIFRGFSGKHICYSFNWVTITSLSDSSWCDMV